MNSRISGLGAAALALALAFTPGIAAADGDAAAGQKVFKKCSACHPVEAGKNKVGPSLAGIFGRTAGTVDGFGYTDALSGSGLVWDEEALDRFLADPKGVVPGTKMTFAGLKKEDDRENVIAYLRSLGN